MGTLQDDGRPRALVIAADGTVVTDRLLPGAGWASPGTGGHATVMTAANNSLTVAWVDVDTGKTTWHMSADLPRSDVLGADGGTQPASDAVVQGLSVTTPSPGCSGLTPSAPRAIATVAGDTLVIDMCGAEGITITSPTTGGPFSQLVLISALGSLYAKRGVSTWYAYFQDFADRLVHGSEQPGTQTEVLAPMTTDGRGWDGVLVNEAGKLAAYDHQRHKIWSVDGPSPIHLATVGDVVIYAERSSQKVTCVNAHNGHQLWAVPLEGISAHDIHQAFTDGRALSLVSGTMDDGHFVNNVLTLDISTGRTMWQRTLPGSVQAVDGHLVGQTETDELVVYQ